MVTIHKSIYILLCPVLLPLAHLYTKVYSLFATESWTIKDSWREYKILMKYGEKRR